MGVSRTIHPNATPHLKCGRTRATSLQEGGGGRGGRGTVFAEPSQPQPSHLGQGTVAAILPLPPATSWCPRLAHLGDPPLDPPRRFNAPFSFRVAWVPRGQASRAMTAGPRISAFHPTAALCRAVEDRAAPLLCCSLPPPSVWNGRVARPSKDSEQTNSLMSCVLPTVSSAGRG